MLIAWRWNVRVASTDGRRPADSWDIAVTHTYLPEGEPDGPLHGTEGHRLLMQWRNAAYPQDPTRRNGQSYFVTEEARRGVYVPLNSPVPFWRESISNDLEVLVAFGQPNERYGDNEQERGAAFRVGYRYRDQISWLKRLDPLLNEKYSQVVPDQPDEGRSPGPQPTTEGTEDVPHTAAGMDARIRQLLRTPRRD